MSRFVTIAIAAVSLALPGGPGGASASADPGLIGPPSPADLPAPEAPAAETERLGLGPAPQAAVQTDSHEAGATLGGGGPPEHGWTRTVVALAVVLGLILAVAAGFRRLSRSGPSLAVALGPGGPSPSGVLEVLGRYPAGRAQSLVLLKVDRRVLLLSQSHGGRFGGGGFRTLCIFEDPEDVASLLVKSRDAANESLSARFTAMLRRFDATHVPTDETVMAPREVALADESPLDGLRRRVSEIRQAGLGGTA